MEVVGLRWWWRWWLSLLSFSLAGAVVVAVVTVIWEGGGCLHCCLQWAVEAWCGSELVVTVGIISKVVNTIRKYW